MRWEPHCAPVVAVVAHLRACVRLARQKCQQGYEREARLPCYAQEKPGRSMKAFTAVNEQSTRAAGAAERRGVAAS